MRDTATSFHLAALTNGHGESAKKPTLMESLDTIASQQITISKGMAWVIGGALAIVPILIAIGVYLIGGSMSYQTVVSRVGVTETRLDKDEKDIEQLKQMVLAVNTIQSDVHQIKESQSKDETAEQELIKNVSDLRIMAASNQLK